MEFQVNPEDKPQLVMEKVRYSMGDILRGNCTSPPASIPTNMTWLVNGKSMNASYIRLENVTHAQTSPKTPMYLTVAGIELEITSFQVGKLKIQCQAEVFQYKSVKKIVLDEERPQLAQVLGTRTSSSANIVLNMEPMTLLLWSALQILLICWSTR
ncbi:uncharacterized protein LOC103507065 [Diaphorina citri]|uniref:Uncharacterized protein LOC103507065 n=1 Tax=Diaphorina citri TaxID=121845 RepID=A0A1S3CXB4_DIACI|nr:uncharacterized protein LOC103507065 [Diaphorina citri]